MPPLSEPVPELSSSTHSSDAIAKQENEEESAEVSPSPLSERELPAIKKSRKVSFAKTGNALRVLHINNYTPTERAACWYSSEENKTMRQEMLQSIRLLHMAEQADGEPEPPQPNSSISPNQALHIVMSGRFNARGLVGRTPAATKRRKETRIAALKAVLVEQQLQWEEGSEDPEYIAMIYAAACTAEQEAAQKRGEKDQEEAR